MERGTIRRSCSYSTVISLPQPTLEYSAIEVTFSQNQETIIQKNKNDLTLGESSVLVQLTQEETALFRPSKKSPTGARLGSEAYMQIRAYKSEYDAPGSKCWPMDVYDSLSEEVLGNG